MSQISYTQAKAVREYTLDHDGGTFHFDGTPAKLTEGYALSLNPEWTRVLPVDEFTSTQVTMYFHDFAWPNQYIGTWVHEGEVHFDVVTVVNDLEEALTLAVLNDQLAIYDLATGEEMVVADVLEGREEEDYDRWLNEDHDDFPEYLEWQDLPWGGDDWDHGQYDDEY